LYRLLHYPHEVFSQGIQVRFITELDAEGYLGISSVVPG
jgi:hypothetical protein